MIKLKGKTYRNTQEQVAENANDIEDIQKALEDLEPTEQEIVALKERVRILEEKTAVIEETLDTLTISTSMIQESAVTTSKINDGAVTSAKLGVHLYQHYVHIDDTSGNSTIDLYATIITTSNTQFTKDSLITYLDNIHVPASGNHNDEDGGIVNGLFTNGTYLQTYEFFKGEYGSYPYISTISNIAVISDNVVQLI